MKRFSWQQLGAFVQVIENCSDAHLDAFAGCGGSWVVPVLIGDEASGPANHAGLSDFRRRCEALDLRVGLWANGWGEDAAVLAQEITMLAKGGSLYPVVVDLEMPYKAPNEAKLPELLLELRRRMPTRPIGLSSFGFADRAMIWNGRTLDPPRSLYDLRVRWLPQWYYLYDGKYAADWSMADLKARGAIDGNIADPDAPGGRGIPLSYAHGTLEVTGVEEHELAVGLEHVRRARAHGFGYGFSIYVLERTPPSDFALLAAQRGKLFK